MCIWWLPIIYSMARIRHEGGGFGGAVFRNRWVHGARMGKGAARFDISHISH